MTKLDSSKTFSVSRRPDPDDICHLRLNPRHGRVARSRARLLPRQRPHRREPHAQDTRTGERPKGMTATQLRPSSAGLARPSKRIFLLATTQVLRYNTGSAIRAFFSSLIKKVASSNPKCYQLVAF